MEAIIAKPKTRKMQKIFASGRPMPDNLFHHNIEKFKHIKFRCQLNDGSFKTIANKDGSPVSEETACLIAHKIKSEGYTRAPKEEPNYLGEEFGYWIESYILDYLMTKPQSEVYLKGNAGTIRKYFAPIANFPVGTIKQKDLLDCWQKMSPHVQHRVRYNLMEMISFINQDKVRLKLENGNPFVGKRESGFLGKPKPKKVRNYMPKEIFSYLLKASLENGMNFLYDALRIGLVTGMRVTDVITLRWDHLQGDKLVKIITKSINEQNDLCRANGYDLSQHTQILEVIEEAKLRLPKDSDCPFIIFHEYDRQVKSKKKLHRNAVTRFYIANSINKLLDLHPILKDIPNNERPGFHEIRALANMLLDQDGIQAKMRAAFLSHKSETVLRTNYSTQNPVELNWVTAVPRLESVNQ